MTKTKANKTLFINGVIHSGPTHEQIAGAMLVENGIIKTIFDEKNMVDLAVHEGAKIVDLKGRYVYPCLIDGHTHMLLTIAVMAMGFNICEITARGVEPNTIDGVKTRLQKYASKQKKDAIIACNNYILTAIDEKRMPTKEELDDWCGGRAVVVYNIDGHSTSLSSKMLELVGIDSKEHSGILQGEENERTQGRIIDKISTMITLPVLAQGIAKFQNTCADYGISVVGALEGNGDSKKDFTTSLIAKLARHFDVGVRLYLQYMDLDRVVPFINYMKNPRVGGCGDWEMDGAIGAHTAAMVSPYIDTNAIAECYYSQQYVDDKVAKARDLGYQVASHAIGERAIERVLTAFNKANSPIFNRIEHCEFMTEESLKEICKANYAVMMQPGYSWIDKRYLHTYERYLSSKVLNAMKLKEMIDAGVCVCGSSDSPVQDIDPYLQMLGMVQYYNESESISPYEAFKCYTINAAKAILEQDERGSLEEGKVADFFLADKEFFSLKPEEVVSFRPVETWYCGEKYTKKKGSILELIKMLLTKPKKI